MLIALTFAVLLLGGEKTPTPGQPPLVQAPLAASSRSIPSQTIIDSPAWVRAPRIGFPVAAAESDVVYGWADVRCVVLDDGRLSQCALLQETPAGYGFGDEALAALSLSRVTPELAGATVQQRVRFQLAG